jgi:nucleotide-binding universal stress UspA family protein
LKITRILVPTDGSDTARKAAEYAFGLAGLFDATVTLLTVVAKDAFVGRPLVPVTDDHIHTTEPLEDYLREAAEEDMEQLENTGRARGITTKKVIRYGRAAEEIVKEAETSNSDLIVLGSHGRSALRTILVGSVANSVIQHETKVPVLVIRR